MQVRNPILRFLIFLVLIIAFQRGLAWVLSLTPLTGIWYLIVFELIMAFVFAYIYFPAPYRKGCLTNPKFHMYVAGFFAALILMQLLWGNLL